jgi:WD40 repeat-containing protein SMU1
VAAALSPRGEYAYGLCADGVLVAFALGTPAGGVAKVAHQLSAHERDGLGLALHPHRNCVATFSAEGVLKLWKP